MIRGTTPTHRFTLPVDTGTVKTVRILYAQNEQTVITKNTADCAMEGNVVSVTLTQEDTLKLDHTYPVYVQIRALTTGGAALASKPARREVDVLLENEVLT